MNTNIEKKYLKYKQKYFKLLSEIKNNQLGGKLIIQKEEDSYKINLFQNQDMEKYLNPIYGLIYCENGYFRNIYHLSDLEKAISTDTTITQQEKDIISSYLPEKKILTVIKKSLNMIDENIRPHIDIETNINCRQIGIYIAIKYIYMKKKDELITYYGNNIGINDKCTFHMLGSESKDKIIEEYQSIDRILKKKKIKFNDNEIIYFMLILFILWWKADTIDDLTEYYNGIKYVFNRFDEFRDESVYFKIDDRGNNFTKTIYDLTNNLFNIIEYSKSTYKNIDYPDCGETAIRNFINLFCFDGEIFNLKQAIPKKGDGSNKFEPIQPLKDYYKKYYNLRLQISQGARNDWSELLIEHANKFIHFNNKKDSQLGYNIKSGLSLNTKDRTTNFIQVLRNLFEGLNDIEDTINKNIISINKDIKEDGFGKIQIEHSRYGIYDFLIQDGHYAIDEKNKESILFKLSDLEITDVDKLNHIESLLPEYTDNNNYIYIDFRTNESLKEIYNKCDNLYREYLGVSDIPNVNKMIDLKIKIFLLSLSKQISSDIRLLIYLDVNESKLFDVIKIIHKNNEYSKKLDEYFFESNDLQFISFLPRLENLNFSFKNRDIQTIDLTPLINHDSIKSLGNYFLSLNNRIVNLDLRPLTKIEKIGDGFLSRTKISNISLPPNLIEIGNYFMSYCHKIRQLTLPNKIKSLGDFFMINCSVLTTIIIPPSIRNIGIYFGSESNFLQKPQLPDYVVIGEFFMTVRDRDDEIHDHEDRYYKIHDYKDRYDERHYERDLDERDLDERDLEYQI